MKLVFVHGWGLTPSFWDGVRARVDYPSDVVDFGFFGPADLRLPEQDCVLVGHSMGGLWALNHLPPRCRFVLVFNGFARFTRAEGFREGVPVRVLDRMLARLSVAPAQVIGDFLLRAGVDYSGERPERDRLYEGLRGLRDWDARREAARLGKNLLMVASEDDPVAPSALVRASLSGAPEARWRWVATGGHVLPLANPDLCADAVREALALASNGA